MGRPNFCCFLILFLLGMIFCYLVILNAAFGWLYSQTVEFATVVPQAEDYISIIMLLEIGFGIAFQLPLVCFISQSSHCALLHTQAFLALCLRSAYGDFRHYNAGRLACNHDSHVCGTCQPL